MALPKDKASKVIKTHEFMMRAAIKPQSFDQQSRKLTVTASAGTRVKRKVQQGLFDEPLTIFEELVISPEAIRMRRFENGSAPVIISHGMYRGQNIQDNIPIGVVEAGRIVNGELLADIRLSSRESLSEVLQDIGDGIFRNISVGYIVHKYEIIVDEETGIDIYRAIDWEPVEVSFVPVPFDPESQTRSFEKEGIETTIIKRAEGETHMDDLENKEPAEGSQSSSANDGEMKTEVPAKDGGEQKPVDGESPKPSEGEGESNKGESEKSEQEEGKEEDKDKEDENEASDDSKKEADGSKSEVEGERERSLEIMNIVKRAGLDTDTALDYIKRGVSLDEVRKQVIDKWSERGAKPVKTIQGGYDRHDIIKRGVVDALMHRHDPKNNELSDQGREFRGMTLIEVAKECLELQGIKTRGMSKSQVASKILSFEYHMRAAGLHGSSDFPLLLADVANKALRQAYQQAPQTWRPFVRTVTSPDFKNINRVQLGEAPTLQPLNEHGLIQYGTMGESREQYALASYARGFRITREAIINDDTDAFTRAPMLFGRAGANLESDLVYAQLNLNANMSDSNPLFDSANHGNVTTSNNEAPSIAALDEMEKLGMEQTGIDGETLIDVSFAYLLAPPAIKASARQIVADVQPQQIDNFNPFAGKYEVIIDPRLGARGTKALASTGSDTAYYLMADPAVIDTLEIAFLEGEEGVRIDQEVDFDSKGLKITALHDVASKAIDWRGMVKNPGA